jgi:hypothetical protein
MLQFFERALERRQIVAQRARNGLIERTVLPDAALRVLRLWILCHREKCANSIMKTGSRSVN